jgi:hypothetical protein
MYQNPVLPVAVPAGAAGVAAGYSVDWVWMLLAAFALLAAATAVMRIVPRNGEL